MYAASSKAYRILLPTGVLGWLIAIACGSHARAAEQPDVATDVAMVQPMIGESTAVVVKIDTPRLALPDLAGAVKPFGPASEERYRRWTQSTAELIDRLRTATGGQPVYATVGLAHSERQWPTFVFVELAPGVDQKALAEQLDTLAQEVRTGIHNNLFVATPGRHVNVAAALDAIVPSERKHLDEAFRAVAQYPIQVLLIPPDYVRRTVVELMPELPRHLGGGPSDVLTEGIVWAAFGLDPGQLRAELVVQSASGPAAQRLAQRLPEMLQSAYDAFPQFQQRMERGAFAALLPLIAPTAEGDRVVLRMDEQEATGGSLRLVTVITTTIQDQIRRGTNTDKFKQILLAMHNYYDTYKMFPPRDKARDEQGNPGLSWRVHILPFVEEQKLYEQFHLDEPWDSTHNRTLIEKIPKAYQGQQYGVPRGHTAFLAPVGEDTVFGGRKATTFRDITDGTSNTVVLVEVKPELAVPWTAPQDYLFDPAAPGRGLGAGPDGRFLAGLADGSVNLFRADVAPQLLLRLFRKSDGQVVDWNELR